MSKKMNDLKPSVSIITVVYNNAGFIEKTIKSVLDQTYDDKEYIIIDGASKDGTLDIIEKYQDKIDYLISEADKGIYDAMNKGLRAASGDYVIFMNSGDLFSDKEVLAKIFNHRGKEADVLYGETYLMKENGEVLGTRSELTTRKLPKTLTYESMKYGMLVSHQSILVKRKLAAEYDLSYKCSADIDWVIKSLKGSKVIVNTGLIISKYLIGGFSVKNQQKGWKERFSIYKKHYGFFITLWSHFFIIIKNLKHKLAGKKNF